MTLVNSDYLKRLLALILSIMIWAGSFAATKYAYQCFTPLFLCLVRFFLAAVLLTIIRTIRKEHKPLPKRDRKAVILTALTGITVYYSFENLALSLTSASNAAVITAVYPVFTIIIGYCFFHDRIPLKQLSGILIAIAGILFITVVPGSEKGSGEFLGNILLIINGFMWGLYNYLVHGVSKETDTSTFTYYMTVFGALFLLPVVFLESPVLKAPLNGPVLIALFFLTAGCSIIAYYLYNYGLRKVSVGTTMAIMNLMPVFGLFFSAVLLHEVIGLREILGALAVIAGVMISARNAGSGNS